MYLNHAPNEETLLQLISNPHACISFSQFGEDTCLWSIFETWGVLDSGFFIDVGAYHPFHYSNTYLFYLLRGWRGINIDANPSAIELFDLHRPRDININAAIADTPSEVALTLYSAPAACTLDPEMRARQAANPNMAEMGQILLRTRRLDDVLAEHAIPSDITLLSVDAEGLDLSVLRSVDLAALRPKFVAVEDHAMNLGDVSENPIYLHLWGAGYRLYSHVFVTSIYVLR